MAKKLNGYSLFQKNISSNVTDVMSDPGEIGEFSKVCGRAWQEIGPEARQKWRKESSKENAAEAVPPQLKCESCSRVFKKEKLLRHHIKNDCGIAHECGTCQKTFKSKDGLARHLKSHTSDIQCEVCGKCFSTLTMLNRHMATHSSEKAFSCEECASAFNLLSNLKKHQKKMHK